MAQVVADNDPFYMTFGKENWNEANHNQGKMATKEVSTKKKTKLMFGLDINSERPRRSS